jgi:hypothetical protein
MRDRSTGYIEFGIIRFWILDFGYRIEKMDPQIFKPKRQVAKRDIEDLAPLRLCER